MCEAAADARDQSGGAGRGGRGGDGPGRSGSPASRTRTATTPRSCRLLAWRGGAARSSAGQAPAQRGGRVPATGTTRGKGGRGPEGGAVGGWAHCIWLWIVCTADTVLRALSRWALPRRLFATVMPRGPSPVAHVATCHQSRVRRHVPHRPTLCNLHPPVAVPWVPRQLLTLTVPSPAPTGTVINAVAWPRPLRGPPITLRSMNTMFIVARWRFYVVLGRNCARASSPPTPQACRKKYTLRASTFRAWLAWQLAGATDASLISFLGLALGKGGGRRRTFVGQAPQAEHLGRCKIFFGGQPAQHVMLEGSWRAPTPTPVPVALSLAKEPHFCFSTTPATRARGAVSGRRCTGALQR